MKIRERRTAKGSCAILLLALKLLANARGKIFSVLRTAPRRLRRPSLTRKTATPCYSRGKGTSKALLLGEKSYPGMIAEWHGSYCKIMDSKRHIGKVGTPLLSGEHIRYCLCYYRV